jgi:hypothetical protein
LSHEKTQSSPLPSFAKRTQDVPPKTFVTDLVALRHEYQEFAADKTRVGSMRQMAAEFVLKLNPIIKSALKVRLETEAS